MKNKKQHIHIQSENYDINITTTGGNIIAPIGSSRNIINVDDRPFQYRDDSGEVLYRCDICPNYHPVGHPHFA